MRKESKTKQKEGRRKRKKKKERIRRKRHQIPIGTIIEMGLDSGASHSIEMSEHLCLTRFKTLHKIVLILACMETKELEDGNLSC